MFSRYYPTPYYELDMAGSLFSLDLSSDGRYLIAGGKHVHANQFGNGGDLYVVDLDLPAEEAVLTIIDTVWTNADTVCLCQDTVLLSPRFTNTGYAPLVLDSTYIRSLFFDDTSYMAVDTSQWGTIVNPSDTIAVRAWYAPCPFHPFHVGRCLLFANTSADTVEFHCGIPSDSCLSASDDIFHSPSSFTLSAYPNPFNSSTTLSFTLSHESDVRLSLVNVLGREVKTIADKPFAAGNHQIILNAENLSTGIYFVRLESSFGIRTQKLMLIR